MRRGALLRLLLLALVIGGAAFVAWHLGLFELREPERLAAAIRRAREVTGIVPLFVVIYAVVATFGLPATPLTLAGGAIFGTALGSLLNWLGAVLGASGAYWLARLIGSDSVRRLLGRHAERLDALLARPSFVSLIRLRLIPLVPFNAINFGSGLAGIPFRTYAAATALGIVPGTVIYTYFADSLLAGVEGASARALLNVAVAAALLIAISFSPAVVRKVRGGKQ